MSNVSDKVWKRKSTQQLAETLASIDDVQVLKNFLCDLMSEKEIIEISARLEAAMMLRSDYRYAEIIKKTQLSSRTVARISDTMKNGKGYASVLSRGLKNE